jgi:pimeloyl-ACP methyl ester carboxylesterase
MTRQSFVDVEPEWFDGRYADGYVDSGGVRLHYTEWNPEGSQTVVLVHGLNVQTHTWDPIAEALSDRYRVICPDLRGHGDSAWAPDYWLPSFVSDLAALTSQLGLSPFSLVGHSLGARIVLAFAGEHTDQVDKVALSDTGPQMSASGSKFTQSVLATSASVKGFRDENEAAALFREQNPEWREVYIRLHARHQLRRNWADKLVFKADPELFWLTGSAGKRDDSLVWERTAQITVPTLVLRGELSPFIDDELAERMLDALKSGSIVTIPNCGHYIPRENPEALMAAIVPFLES